MSSDANPEPASPSPSPVILALDTGSPTVSVALARDGELLIEDRVEIGHSSRRLLPMIDAALAQAGLPAVELGGIVALAGPGSFTGLRVGLATALGLHQALAVPAAALPTLPALARAVAGPPLIQSPVTEPGRGIPDNHGIDRVFALVDVLRDEWACQEFEAAGGGAPRSRGAAERLPVADLVRRLAAALAASDGRVVVAGFGVEALADRLPEDLAAALDAGRLTLSEPAGLAGAAALAATAEPPEWNAASLTAPLYFRPPATTTPKRLRATPAPPT